MFATHLESLIILTSESDRRLPAEPPQPLVFPLLRVFQHQLDYLNLEFITTYWEFSVLDTLASFARPYDIEDNIAFLEAHGERLKTLLLDWPKYLFDTTSTTELEEVIATLPHLRHLIIPPFLDISASQTIMWSPTEELVLFSDHDRNIHFPNLLSYRVLDSELARKLPLLPILLPPTTEECRFTFPGVDIRCDTSALLGWSTLDQDKFDYSSGGSDWEVESDSDLSSDSESGDEDSSWDGEEQISQRTVC
ncbi:hypothetical protein BDP27DRAFT_1450595 [Rhodocollybia butyracea]|uniref:Uncharacterized protein n=1 Tax=Rhodocollybia butyracea TaxID=206335 RepID=A0A9P5PIZ1_9AGAR|nr:hypothetical protein BDP27DRAFT_1450595 [Rhodocollybia butyracea]